MKISLIIPLLVFVVFVTPVFAELPDKIITTSQGDYEFSKITKEYTLSSKSLITKTQGYTTTGEQFFLRVSPLFEKIMILDTTGHWLKATLQDKPTNPILEPTNSVVVGDKKELHFLTEQYDRVYNKSEYKLFVKTFDASIYSGSDFQNFEGKISGAKISGIIIDPSGVVKKEFVGYTENGEFTASVMILENIWTRGWYTVDMVIEYDGKFYPEQLSFYVFGQPRSDSGSSSCQVEGQIVVDGVCECPAGEIIVDNACQLP